MMFRAYHYARFLQAAFGIDRLGHEKTFLSRQIEATDRQIDTLGYELYGLTEEEDAIGEEAAR
ncbi:hypothetical protein [Candidatus Methanocrinis natronophilus]|uniref:Uncharacterized protein n=1 Tax=Candidatus Methanocrinis natronophilus TaxID=3033396 RepID=A0ABT5X6K1_9EURY|nr:hypothetical protein [Candidatus Methanocrinis natronophilus]MDF0590325.1 hypothetical protein [Candidatus Methanocrinis natronophilus]